MKDVALRYQAYRLDDAHFALRQSFGAPAAKTETEARVRDAGPTAGGGDGARLLEFASVRGGVERRPVPGAQLSEALAAVLGLPRSIPPRSTP